MRFRRNEIKMDERISAVQRMLNPYGVKFKKSGGKKKHGKSKKCFCSSG